MRCYLCLALALGVLHGDAVAQPTGTMRTEAFDRFGIVTSWIDGNSQDVYWDDLSYTLRQQ